jgi:hypothetical protein
MKRLIAAIAKMLGRTPVWEIPKTKPTAPVPKEKRIKNPLLPVVIVLILLMLSLTIWNTVTLLGIKADTENLYGPGYRLPELPRLYGGGDIDDIKAALRDIERQLDDIERLLR